MPVDVTEIQSSQSKQKNKTRAMTTPDFELYCIVCSDKISMVLEQN